VPLPIFETAFIVLFRRPVKWSLLQLAQIASIDQNPRQRIWLETPENWVETEVLSFYHRAAF